MPMEPDGKRSYTKSRRRRDWFGNIKSSIPLTSWLLHALSHYLYPECPWIVIREMFRIHWKGCPHRHLPRIRLPLIRSPASRARLAQDASEAVNLLPFSPALKKAREKERTRARKRRRIRSHKSSHETTVSLKALRDIEVFGWNSPRYLDSLGVENNGTGLEHEGIFSPAKRYQIIESISRVPNGLVEYSGNRPRHRMDGACSSKTPSSPPANIPRERRFTPVHWNKRTRTGKDTLPTQVTFEQHRISGAYLPHFTSTQPTTEPTRTVPTPAIPQGGRSIRIPIRRVPKKGVPITNAPSRSRTYDPRVPIKKAPVAEVRRRVTKLSPKSPRSPGLSRRVSVTSKAISRSSKRRGWTSPEFRTALSSVISQQENIRGGTKASISTIDVTEPSRTSSERRAVEKFTLELAKSLADPEKLKRPTPQSTAPSLHTVNEFKPYAPEFRAAGLSVTFHDQVLTSPRLRDIHTPAKEKANDPAYLLNSFSFERKRFDGPADMQKSPAKAPVKAPAWNSETPTDQTSTSAGSSFGEGHHHVRRVKLNAISVPPTRLPPIPPRPPAKPKTVVPEAAPKMEKKAPPRPPSEFSSSSASMSWTEGHHHVRAAKINAAQGPKPVMPPAQNVEMTPTPAPRRVPTQFVPPAQPPRKSIQFAAAPVQPPRKSIPWLQTGEASTKRKSTITEGPTAWQQQNIISPDRTTSDSSNVTVIDWSPIEDPRANLSIFPLVARPTEVEWVEMNFDRGASSPVAKIIDMKKQEGDITSTVEVIPVEQPDNARRKTIGPVPGPFRASPKLLDRSKPLDKGKEISAMIVPVNVISITPVSSIYSIASSRKRRPQIPEKPLLCTRCGRLLVSPPPASPPRLAKLHDCTRKSSVCENCAPSEVEAPASPKKASIRVEQPSPTGPPPPPIIPARSLRRTGNLFQAPPPMATSTSVVTYDSELTERVEEIIGNRQPTSIGQPDQVVELIPDENPPVTLLPPEITEQVDPVSKPNDVLNKDFPPTSQTKVNTPRRLSPVAVALSHRASIDTIADIISYYSPTESISATTLATLASEDLDPKAIRDKDVFRGLQVVTLAACDKNVDAWIKDMSGAGIRKFLADVGGFEKMGIGELSRLARRTARRRRRELDRALKGKEKEVAEAKGGGQDQNDGVEEGSCGSSGSSTVRGWKAVDTSHGIRDGRRGKQVMDERVCHVWEPGTGMETSDRETEDDTGKHECGCCGDEGNVDKGKGKEKEITQADDVKSRRDRFGVRDGYLY